MAGCWLIEASSLFFFLEHCMLMMCMLCLSSEMKTDYIKIRLRCKYEQIFYRD
jgi:hypothetical protein